MTNVENIRRRFSRTFLKTGCILLCLCVNLLLLSPIDSYSSSETVSIPAGSSSPSSGKFYIPDSLNVPRGTTVTWTNDDSVLHTVTSGSPVDDPSGIEFDSSYLAAGKTFQHTFLSAGNFDYYCTLHPFMTGSVKVSSSSTIQPTQTTNSSGVSATDPGTLSYSNYTSDKYQIQIQYPTNWELKEKSTRFDEGADIQVSSPQLGSEVFFIIYGDDLRASFGSPDFTTAFYHVFKEAISSDYSKEYRVIEQPSFLTIGDQKAGTFLFTSKDKYEDYASTWASQSWVVFVRSHGYLISFLTTTDEFDSPENIAIRDHFIKSINFLGASSATQNNQTSRFD